MDFVDSRRFDFSNDDDDDDDEHTMYECAHCTCATNVKTDLSSNRFVNCFVTFISFMAAVFVQKLCICMCLWCYWIVLFANNNNINSKQNKLKRWQRERESQPVIRCCIVVFFKTVLFIAILACLCICVPAFFFFFSWTCLYRYELNSRIRFQPTIAKRVFRYGFFCCCSCSRTR